MTVSIGELTHKEIVNMRDGYRLGYVGDVQLDLAGGRCTALIVPGRMRFFGLFGREDDYILPWDVIRRIGDDIILIDVEGDYRRAKPGLHRW